MRKVTRIEKEGPMTRIRILSLVLTLGVALCLPQLALAETVAPVTLSGTVAAAGAPHTYVLQVRQPDGTTVIGSRTSGPHAAATAAAAVAAPLAGTYDANLYGLVTGAVVTLKDMNVRAFRTYLSDNSACTGVGTPIACCTGVGTGTCFSEITVATPVTLAGITFTRGDLLTFEVPALSAQGVLIFLLIASGALLFLRRRRSGRMEV
jgi:hypothetical protein